MWGIYKHKNAIKQLKSLPIDVLKQYEKWKDIVTISGPKDLKQIKGFRELQELSQNKLSSIAGIPQSTLSAIEHDKIKLGVERAKVLARALVPPSRFSFSWLGY